MASYQPSWGNQPYTSGDQPGPAPQPAQYAPPAMAGEKPSAYWPLSIIALLFSLLFGIIAVVFSAQVGSNWKAGDVEGAMTASRRARLFGIIGILVGVVVTMLVVAVNA